MKTLDIQHGIQLKSILFLTDFSEPAKRAGKYAAALAKTYGARLNVLHVFLPTTNANAPVASWYGVEEATRLRSEEYKKELRAEFQTLNPNIIIREGLLWPEVTATVKKENIDLIVVGTHGRTGVKQFFLGSVAEEIFRSAECPVLTVGPAISSTEEPPSQFSRILYPTDFGEGTKMATAYALSLAQEHQAYVTLLHVIAEPKTGEFVEPHDVSAADEAELRKLIPVEAEKWCVPEVLVERGRPAEKILDVAARRRAQLIVMGVRKQSGFPGAATHLPISVAHEVVSKAHCPVLTVRV